ncbi:unnamed protein product, partial [Effrenium voratum]
HPMGSMMYYESATLVHGKPMKLPEGSLHVGLFVHFRPLDWETQGHVEFCNRRLSGSITFDNNEGARMEAFGARFEVPVPRAASFDMEEGTYEVPLNNCGEEDQRSDLARLNFAMLDAVKGLRKDAVERLLDSKADVNFQDRNLWSAAHEAARAGDLDTLQLLVDHRADLGARTRQSHTVEDL